MGSLFKRGAESIFAFTQGFLRPLCVPRTGRCCGPRIRMPAARPRSAADRKRQPPPPIPVPNLEGDSPQRRCPAGLRRFRHAMRCESGTVHAQAIGTAIQLDIRAGLAAPRDGAPSRCRSRSAQRRLSVLRISASTHCCSPSLQVLGLPVERQPNFGRQGFARRWRSARSASACRRPPVTSLVKAPGFPRGRPRPR